MLFPLGMKAHTVIALVIILWVPLLALAQGTQGDWLDELESFSRDLFEAYAPEDIKAEYRIPTARELRQFLDRAQRALYDGDADELAALAPYACESLDILSRIPGGSDYASWLQARLDFFLAAEQAQPKPSPRTGAPPAEASNGSRPAPRLPAPLTREPFWKHRISQRPAPPAAAELIPAIKTVFADNGIPPELTWMAEVESSLNPSARSPAGAVGLFQFMPATARRFGLKTAPVDERRDPLKSADAAARYLRLLYGRFESWPLALAAYNAGEGRVGRALKRHRKTDFESVAPYLPTESRMYVPKVLATIHAREQVHPDDIPGPKEL